MSDDESPRRKSALRTLAELGPAWITAIGGLIAALTAAGFLAGQATSPASNAAPPATQTATTAGVPTEVSNAQTTAPSAATTGTPVNGTQLASYTIKLGNGFSVPLRLGAPSASEQSPGVGTSGDLGYDTAQGGLLPGNGDSMFTIYQGMAATYQTCNGVTGYETSIAATNGTYFCLAKQTWLIGVTVTAVSSDLKYVTLQITIWQNA